MHRTFVRYFQESSALARVEVSFERNDPLDAVEHAFLGFTFGAVGGMNPAVA